MAVFADACRQKGSRFLDTLSPGADGHVSGTVDYDIFGEPVTETGVFASSSGSSGGISALVFAYAGKPYDPVTGLYDYGFRDYTPTLARFTTVDPIRDGSNWYAYCNSDPVNYVDMWGLVCISNSDAQAAADKVAATGTNLGTLGDLSKDPASGINTQEMAEKISRNINRFDDNDKTKAYYSAMPESVRTSAIKERLNKIQVVVGVDPTVTEKEMKGLGIEDEMAESLARTSDAFASGGYIMFFDSDYDKDDLLHEGTHTGLQEYVYGDVGTYLTEYTNEAERLKANGDDWYYGNYFEKSAYQFGPSNQSGNGGVYVH